MIRLLKKEEINEAKAKDRNNEIQEGIKIARKVDNLRNLKADEELALARFRDESLKTITQEISKLLQKKEGILSDIEKLQIKLNALSPEMTAKRKELSELKKKFEKEKEDLDKREEELGLKEIDIAIAMKKAIGDSKRAESHKELAENLHRKAQEEKDEANQILLKAKGVEESAIHLKKDTEESLILRENEINKKEKDLENKEISFAEREKDLAKEKIQVADQRATLERAIKRLRDNRLA